MPASRLQPRLVPKVWGRWDLPARFLRGPRDEPIGEIWFEDQDGGRSALLVKYLFTAEKLSIQVHPDDAAAAMLGFPHGKEEAWWVAEAGPGAQVALGLTRPVSAEELRAAAHDGSLEQLVDWRPARRGDAFHVPPGTIHALGPGLFIVEIQQNVDATLRLYDYGRDRRLHVEQALAAARLAPADETSPRKIDDQRAIVCASGALAVERWTDGFSATVPASSERPVWLVPLGGQCVIDSVAVEFGEAWVVDEPVGVTVTGAALAAYPYSGSGELLELATVGESSSSEAA